MRFSDFGRRVVFAAFDGGEITTDAGVLLLRERARRIHLFERMAACFTDRRDPGRAVHTLPALLAQRVAGIALGYEDINDHDALRHDPACKLLAGGGGKPAPANGKAPPALAGKASCYGDGCPLRVPWWRMASAACSQPLQELVQEGNGGR